MICPTCRFCQDNQLPHLCITRGDQPSANLASLEATYGLNRQFAAVEEALDTHPAQPRGWAATGPAAPVLRAVHWTWCSCGCKPGPALPDGQDRRP